MLLTMAESVSARILWNYTFYRCNLLNVFERMDQRLRPTHPDRWGLWARFIRSRWQLRGILFSAYITIDLISVCHQRPWNRLA